AALEAGDRRAFYERDVCKSDALGCLSFALELFGFAGLAGHEVAVEPVQVAVDALELHDLLDAIDRGAVTFYDQARVPRAEDSLEPVDAVVDRVGQVCSGSPGFTAA